MKHLWILASIALNVSFSLVPLHSQEHSTFAKTNYEDALHHYYTEQALSYSNSSNLTEALEHATYTIENSTVISTELLEAYLSRAHVYLQIDELEKSTDDIIFAQNYIPSWPKIRQKGDSFVVSNFDCSNMSVKTLDSLKKLYVKYGICKAPSDVTINPKKRTLTIRAARTCTFQNQHNHIVMKGVGDSVTACERKCSTAKAAADMLCSSFAIKWGLKGVIPAAACVAGVHILFNQCEDCCVEGFADCEKKMQVMTRDLLDATFPPDSSILD